jgi:Holliday junction resolvase RusA-like endonuclease
MAGATLKIKPLSLNEAYRGRRYNTPKKKAFEMLCMLLLPPTIEKFDRYAIKIEFGFSSHGCDWDNHVKTFQDCLQKKYGINDNKIWDAHVRKSVVPKGEEFIYFELGEFNEY